MRFVFIALSCALAAPAFAQAAAPLAAVASAAAVDRLLEAMGGRAAWAAARGYRVEAVHENAEGRRETVNWVDFARARTRTESRAPGSLRISVLDGGRLQRRRDGDTSAPSAEAAAAERDWWRTNFYRTLHRLAARDPALQAYLTDARLLVFDGGEPLLWMTLNIDGSPKSWGADFNRPGTVFGPLRAYGPVRVPADSRRGAAWRGTVTAFELNPDLAAVPFDRP